jgi:hypothetical protein
MNLVIKYIKTVIYKVFLKYQNSLLSAAQVAFANKGLQIKFVYITKGDYVYKLCLYNLST